MATHGDSSLPFPVGSTFLNGVTYDSNDPQGASYEGREYIVEDINYDASTAGTRTLRTNRLRRLRVVKNVGAAALLPKRTVSFYVSGTNYGAQVDGYTDTTAERGYPVDEWLPAAGCPVNDWCYVVVDGPATCLTPLAGAEFNGDITEGTVLVALTAATSGATTAGRLAVQNITGSTQTADYSFILNQAENYVGRALSAKTTGNTNASILVEVGHW